MILGELDRRGDEPPYQQIAGQLRAAIDHGELQPGDRLPSEAELTAHYGVARMTARQAIAELRSEGLVAAEHGRGTFVLPASTDLRATVAALEERVARLEAMIIRGDINRR